MAHDIFVSYSSLNKPVADALCATLESQGLRCWIAPRDIMPGRLWTEAIIDGIAQSRVMVLVYSANSNSSPQVFREVERAVSAGLAIVPFRIDAAPLSKSMQYLISASHWLDALTDPLEEHLERLAGTIKHLLSPGSAGTSTSPQEHVGQTPDVLSNIMGNPPGPVLHGPPSLHDRLHAMKHRLVRSRGDLVQALTPEKARIEDEIAWLEMQIAEMQRVFDDPAAAIRRTEQAIASEMQQERDGQVRLPGIAKSRFVNAPPDEAPGYFQDRVVETKWIGDLIRSDGCRLITVVGRGGTGKTALVCRLLKAMESGELPDGGGSIPVDGIVYQGGSGTRRITAPHLYCDLCRLIPGGDTQSRLISLYKDPLVTTDVKMRSLLNEFMVGRTVVLLDNFEDLIDSTNETIRDTELDEMLRAVLTAQRHVVTVVLTSRIAPRNLQFVQPSRQEVVPLDGGLPTPYAVTLLREMDSTGRLGLRSAPDALLHEAVRRTMGYPRALEMFKSVLSADRDATLSSVLEDLAATDRFELKQESAGESDRPTHRVIEVLVGEAFKRLDGFAQRVLQALAIYGTPVPAVAIDFLLQPWEKAITSKSVLSRLANMDCVRFDKDVRRYYLHPVDRDYALSTLKSGVAEDRQKTETGPADSESFSLIGLYHRAATYFNRLRKPLVELHGVDDFGPYLAEFDMRVTGGDFLTAFHVQAMSESDRLIVMGYARVVLAMQQRLEGKLDDPTLKHRWLRGIGHAYGWVGQPAKAVECFREALPRTRDVGDRDAEGSCLGELGYYCGMLGDNAEAKRCHNQALAIARELKAEGLEANQLSCLGNVHGELGNTAEARDCYRGAEVWAINSGNNGQHSEAVTGIARILIDQGHYDEAVRRAQESSQIASQGVDRTQNSYANAMLALAELLRSNLSAALTAAEVARRYDDPFMAPVISLLIGTASLCRRDLGSAQAAFADAVAQAEVLLAYNSRNHSSLDVKGLSLCGLAVCGKSQHLPDATATFKLARAVNCDPGTVARTRRLFDVIALHDTVGILVIQRSASGGSHLTHPV